MTIAVLDADVVNKIAAGEVIMRPANAVKELLENAIDAGATLVEIVVVDGGLKQVRISDNGHGIARDDLPLLCQRFATLKLRTFSDLQTIATYGFRGEALALISHIARVLVTTRTGDDTVALKAYYVDGRLATLNFKPLDKDPDTLIKRVAGTVGTTLVVDDMFYNLPNRLKLMRLKLEELTKIVEVASRYAIHRGDTCAIRVLTKELMVPLVSSRVGLPLNDRMRQVLGLAGETLDIDVDINGENGLHQIKGLLSSPNFVSKKKVAPVIFINDRLVTCEPLKRAINAVYANMLPRGLYPFYYISLTIDPHSVDVNMHPTKSEVRFLHEDEVIQKVSDVVYLRLQEVDTARSYASQQQPLSKRSLQSMELATKKYRQDSKLVRVDASQLRITRYLDPRPSQAMASAVAASDDAMDSDPADITNNTTMGDASDPIDADNNSDNDDDTDVNLDLASIHELRQEYVGHVSRALTKAFANAAYVGMVDAEKRLVCFQYGVKLYLADLAAVLNQFIYQLCLEDFGRFGTYELNPPVALTAILNGFDNVDETIERLQHMAPMLRAYYRMGIDATAGTLTTLPLIVSGLEPAPGKLPYLLTRLALAPLADEKSYFRYVLQQLALFYLPPPTAATEVEATDNLLDLWVFPELRSRFVAPTTLHHDVIEIADLPGLYRVFERC